MDTIGLFARQSPHSPAETARRLEAALARRGLTIFARVDHACAAKAADLDLRPTEVFLFGDPQAGTPLMAANQTIGIDQRLRALIWQDAPKITWFAYNDPVWLVRRHHLDGDAIGHTIAAMSTALARLAEEVTQP